MIPISDINPARNVPVVSRIFIIISSLTFLFLQPKNNIDLLNYFYKYAAIPCELINNLPISANQFYNNNCSLEPDIVIFPDKNILLSIIVSLFLHANFLHILGSHSLLNFGNLNPIVGASGIVSALMGAYLYLFPNAKLLVLVPFGVFFPTTIKAKYFMIFWLISQFIIAIQSNNISWEAHISGFLFGYLLLKVSKFRRSII